VCVAVLGHRRRCSQPANLPVSDSMFTHNSSTFAKEFRERFSTLKSEFDEVCMLCASLMRYACFVLVLHTSSVTFDKNVSLGILLVSVIYI